MFLFVNKVLPTTRLVSFNVIWVNTIHYDVSEYCSASMGTIYSENRDEDGFLYVAYSGENTFGSHS